MPLDHPLSVLHGMVKKQERELFLFVKCFHYFHDSFHCSCFWGHRPRAGVGFFTFLRLGFMLGFDMLPQALLCVLLTPCQVARGGGR